MKKLRPFNIIEYCCERLSLDITDHVTFFEVII